MSKELKHSDSQDKFGTGAQRDSSVSKSRPDLISPYASFRIGEWLKQGAEKYGERNWEKGMPFSRCVASLRRHLEQFIMGCDDEDHLAAIGCNVVFLLHYEEMIKRGILPEELDDMPKYERKAIKEE